MERREEKNQVEEVQWELDEHEKVGLRGCMSGGQDTHGVLGNG